MIDLDRLGEAAGRLKALDADSGDWSEEADGFPANATRLLAGLEEELAERDFSNPLDAEYRLAPDAVIAALRLGLWTGQAEGELSPGLARIRMLAPTPQAPIAARFLARKSECSPQEAAFAEAAEIIRGRLHDLTEPGREWYARNDSLSSPRRAARLLICSAEMQAEAHNFPLFQALDGRLGELSSENAMIEPV